jgi:hypothetical protein
MSLDIIAIPATNAKALKQRLDALVASTSSPSLLMPSNIVALPAADVEVLKQRLDALVASWPLVSSLIRSRPPPSNSNGRPPPKSYPPPPESTSFLTTETATTSPSYVDTIVANFHIQVDSMMEEIHLDTSGPVATPTMFYSNKMSPAPLSPPLVPPRPSRKNNVSGPGNGNDSNNNRNMNNNLHNDGSGGKNNNTTVASHSATTNDGQGPPTMADVREPVAWAHRHVPRPSVHRTAAAAGFHGHDGALYPTRLCPWIVAVVPVGPSCTSSGLGTLEQRELGPAVVSELLQHHGATAAPQFGQ